MIVDERLHAVASGRIDSADTVFDTCQTVLLRTDPEAAVGGRGHCGHLRTGQNTIIVDDTLVACTIPYLAVGVFGYGCDIAVQERLELVDVVAVIGQSRLLSTNP